MKKLEATKRALSLLLCFVLVWGMLPVQALAEEGSSCAEEGCEGVYADGVCTLCGAEEPEDAVCEHTGGEATCEAAAVCGVCGESYGEPAGHDYVDGVCSVCGDCVHISYEEGKCVACGADCTHTGGEATCKTAAVCDTCGLSYGELAVHNHVDGICSVCGDCAHISYEEGKCASCGADCAHAEYEEGVCKVCGSVQPEPEILTVSAWSWVDEAEVLDEVQDAVIPGVSEENPIDWDTLTELLPAYISAVVGEETVEIPVTWECEEFPAEGATSGDYNFYAVLPEGYVLGEGVKALELYVALGGAETLEGTVTWDGTVAAQAWASGSGTSADPYMIQSSQQLAKLAADVNGGESYSGVYFELGTSLFLNGSTYNWTPIGGYDTEGQIAAGNAFAGVFDGGNNTIAGMSTTGTQGYLGLFGSLSGTVRNLTMEAPVASGSGNHVGAVAGYMSSGDLENCHVISGTIKGTSHVGGIAGYAEGESTIRLCSVTGGTVNCSTYAGGIVATAPNSTIIGCYNLGMNLHHSSGSANIWSGGIVGEGKYIYSCFSSCNVTGSKSDGSGYTGPITYSYRKYKPTVLYCAYEIDAYTRKYPVTYGVGFTTTEVQNGAAAYYLSNGDDNVYTGWGQRIGTDTYPKWISSGNVKDIVHRDGEEGSYTYFNVLDPEFTVRLELPEEGYTYDGQAKEPAVKVLFRDKAVSGSEFKQISESEYQVQYSDNVNAGTDTAKVTVSDVSGGKFQVSGQATFSISPKTIGLEWPNTNLVYTGEPQKPEAVATGLVGEDRCTVTVEGEATNVSETPYTATATAIDNPNYQLPAAGLTTEFYITGANMEDLVSEEDWSGVYDGTAHGITVNMPEDATVTYGTEADRCDQTASPVYTNVGTYTVYYQVTRPNYLAVQGSAQVVVTPAALTITAKDHTVIYGEEPANNGVGFDGFVEGEDAAVLGGTLSFTYSYQNGNDQGTYAITPAGYTSENYAITFADGVLTVAPKVIGISWSNTEMTYTGEPQQPVAEATGLLEGDECTITVTGAQTEAGEGYVAIAAELSNPNYKLPAENTVTFSIANAAQAKPTGVATTAETLKNQANGKISGVNSTMEYRKEGETAYTAITENTTEITELAAGKYYVRFAAKTNYNASEDLEVIVSEGRMIKVYLPTTQTGYALAADAEEVVYNGSVILTYNLAEGYTEGTDFAVTATNAVVEKNQDGTYTVSAITNDTTISVTGVSDVTAPAATITVKDNNWTEFLNTITFGKFFNATQTVTITADDAGSGVDTISYFLSSEAKTLEQVKEYTAWTAYDRAFSISPENQYVIYAKVTDLAGNTTYINSEGFVLDQTNPVITGVDNGGVYYTTQKVSATDNTTLDTLTGTNADGTIPGDPAQETEHTIVATDKAGNSTTFKITMMPIATLSAGLPTEETLTQEDADVIEAVKQNVSTVLTNQCANATDGEKAKLEAIIAQCNALLDQIKQAEDIIALINALPAASKVEPDDKSAIDAYDAAMAAYSNPNLPASSKRMVGEENKAKLAAVGKALVNYEIYDMSSHIYVKGSGKALTITANGYYAKYNSYVENAYGKFVSFEVDGNVVDEEHYTVKAGSTVVTLKTSYLNSLKSGKHTFKVNYVDGSTDGKASFRVTVNNGNPFTGDNSHIMLFGSVAVISLLCLAMMIAFMPRKKGKYQR